jgi:BatD DUF11 like domain
VKRRAIGTKTLAGLVLCLLVSQARADDEPEIAVEAGATEIFIGESVDYSVEIRNAKNPSPPDLTALRGTFDVVANGDESHNRTSMIFNQGRLSQQNTFSHTYHFRLTPKRTGRLVIPAPSATLDGKTISGRALTLNVIAPEKQDLVIAELRTDRKRVYPTQPFEVTLRVLVRPLPDDDEHDPVIPLRHNPPNINVNWVDLPAGFSGEDKAQWLQKLLADNGIGFTLNDITMRTGSFFDGPRPAVFNLLQAREHRKGRDGEDVNYFGYELKRKLIPEKAGTYTLGPGVVKGSFAGGMDGGRYTARRLVAIAAAVPVEVREVPLPRPATFCGGIGNYRMAAAASPTALRVGDPLTLRLDFERGQGSGSLDLISAPNLEANAKLAADFEIIDKNPTGRTEGELKKFEYALRPKRAGVVVPPLAVTVFDPDTEEFSEITTAPVPLKVSEASNLSAGDLVGSLTGGGKEEIKAQAQGIFQNVTDPSELSDQRVNVVALGELAAGAWGLVACLMAVVASQRRRSGDRLWQRKRNARRTANRKMAEARTALAAGESRAALRIVRSALFGLIADLRNIVAEGLTASEVDAALAETAVPADQRRALADLLGEIESAEYGSGAATDTQAMIKTADGLIQSLARHLERNGARE